MVSREALEKEINEYINSLGEFPPCKITLDPSLSSTIGDVNWDISNIRFSVNEPPSNADLEALRIAVHRAAARKYGSTSYEA